MCMILDANMWGDFTNKAECMIPVYKWLEEKKGKLVYSDHKAFQKELTKNQKKILRRYFQSGQARFVPKTQVDRITTDLRKNDELKSNDIHILGLAKASKVKILCSNDKNLHYDFKHILGGSVYQNANHKHLLTKDACP